MTWLDDSIPILLRILLVALFPFSAADKIVNWPVALQQAAGMPLPRLMVGAGAAVEIAAPICIVSQWHDRLAALILGAFCVMTAILFHQFWRFTGFWRFKEGKGLNHFWDFMKNLALAGALGLYALAAGNVPLSTLLHAPLASTRDAETSTPNR